MLRSVVDQLHRDKEAIYMKMKESTNNHWFNLDGRDARLKEIANEHQFELDGRDAQSKAV